MKGEMINVRWIKPHRDYGYFAGNIGQVAEDAIEELTKGGYIQVLPGEEEGDENPLPEDLPGRELLHENGFDLEKASKATEEVLTAITGIGKVTATEILAYFTKDDEGEGDDEEEE